MKTIYLAPSDLEQVLEPLRKDPDGTMVMAGGTALLWAVRLLGKPAMPRSVISLQNLKGLLGQIKFGPGTEVGAQVSLATLAGEMSGGEGIPSILAQAARSVGFPGIRRTATLGGNLANGVMPSQVLPALAALGATVHLRSSSGHRRVELAKSVAEGTYYPIVIPGELITSVSIPRDNIPARQSYVDFAWPGKDPVVIAVVFCQGRLRVALLADQRLSLWVTETGANVLGKERQAELTERACLSFGLTQSSPLSQIDVYRRRGMLVRALQRIGD